MRRLTLSVQPSGRDGGYGHPDSWLVYNIPRLGPMQPTRFRPPSGIRAKLGPRAAIRTADLPQRSPTCDQRPSGGSEKNRR